jgi:steroid delta-isomerase-like uncharacterized protein
VSTQENKALVRRFLRDVMATQNLDVADAVLSPDYTIHMVGLPQPVRGLINWKGLVSTYFAAFPDLDVVLDEEIAEGDRVAIRYGWTGTHRGAFMGIPATGKHVRVAGTVFFQIVDDKIAVEWHQDDVLGLLQQLDVVPAPGQPAAA